MGVSSTAGNTSTASNNYTEKQGVGSNAKVGKMQSRSVFSLESVKGFLKKIKNAIISFFESISLKLREVLAIIYSPKTMVNQGEASSETVVEKESAAKSGSNSSNESSKKNGSNSSNESSKKNGSNSSNESSKKYGSNSSNESSEENGSNSSNESSEENGSNSSNESSERSVSTKKIHPAAKGVLDTSNGSSERSVSHSRSELFEGSVSNSRNELFEISVSTTKIHPAAKGVLDTSNGSFERSVSHSRNESFERSGSNSNNDSSEKSVSAKKIHPDAKSVSDAINKSGTKIAPAATDFSDAINQLAAKCVSDAINELAAKGVSDETNESGTKVAPAAKGVSDETNESGTKIAPAAKGVSDETNELAEKSDPEILEESQNTQPVRAISEFPDFDSIDLSEDDYTLRKKAEDEVNILFQTTVKEIYTHEQLSNSFMEKLKNMLQMSDYGTSKEHGLGFFCRRPTGSLFNHEFHGEATLKEPTNDEAVDDIETFIKLLSPLVCYKEVLELTDKQDKDKKTLTNSEDRLIYCKRREEECFAKVIKLLKSQGGPEFLAKQYKTTINLFNYFVTEKVSRPGVLAEFFLRAAIDIGLSDLQDKQKKVEEVVELIVAFSIANCGKIDRRYLVLTDVFLSLGNEKNNKDLPINLHTDEQWENTIPKLTQFLKGHVTDLSMHGKRNADKIVMRFMKNLNDGVVKSFEMLCEEAFAKSLEMLYEEAFGKPFEMLYE